MSETKLCQIIIPIEGPSVGYAVQVFRVPDVFTENELADLKFSKPGNLIADFRMVALLHISLTHFFA